MRAFRPKEISGRGILHLHPNLKPNNPVAITINQTLIDAGIQYRKDLLTMPVAQLAEVAQFMTIKTGVQGKIIGGILNTNAELRPYKTDKNVQTDGTTIEPYESENYLGDVVKEFDPNAILGTLYTEITAKKPSEREIARMVALGMAAKVGEALYDELFTAVRNSAGTTTHDLFDGFSTLAAKAIIAGTLSAAKKNYQDLTETTITTSNCGEVLKAAYRNCNKLFKKKANVFLYLPTSILEMYEDWYQVEYGTAPWNAGFQQRKLVGSSEKCTFVPLANMEDQDYMFFSVSDNMQILVDQESDKENVRIRECDNPKAVQFFMMSYFGTGYDNLDKAFINVLEFTTESDS